jgi:hypothetical protein
VVGFTFARVGWDNAVLDTHGFRQTQTAISAFWMLRDGFHAAYATPVVGAPWSTPYEFPIYQATTAWLSRHSGLSLDPAGRTVALGFFYLSLPALWLLLRRLGVSATERWLALALVVSCPVYEFYSRAFLIESTAFCFAAWFLYAFRAALLDRSWTMVGVAAAAATLAAVTKITTYFVFAVPAAWMLIDEWRLRRFPWQPLFARAAAAVAPGALLGFWWVQYTDRVKEQNIFGQLQTTAALQEWNYGTLAQRFSGAFWQGLDLHLENALLPASSLLILALLLVVFWRECWRTWLGFLGVALAGPLVFANLYFVHDYYFYANGVFVLLLLALPLRQLFRREAIPLAGRLGVVVLVIISQFAGYRRVYATAQAHAAPEPPIVARAIKQVTDPDDILVGFGMNWSPVLPYYSERRAIMVPDAKLHDDVTIARALARLGPARVAALVVNRGVGPSPDSFARWVSKLEMDPIPLFSTGEQYVFLRKDMITRALQRLQNAKLDIYLYDGNVGKPGAQPRIVFRPEAVKDQSLFAGMHPRPSKVTVPFGLSQEPIAGRLVFNAPASSDVEIPAPAGAHRIHAEFGINPAAYAQSDGVEFEIVYLPRVGYPVPLYRRLVQPWLLKTDQGLQQVELECAQPLDGAVVFRTGPGPMNQANSDWSYWAGIDIR